MFVKNESMQPGLCYLKISTTFSNMAQFNGLLCFQKGMIFILIVYWTPPKIYFQEIRKILNLWVIINVDVNFYAFQLKASKYKRKEMVEGIRSPPKLT